MYDFLSLMPELAAHRTTVTRLRPLPGEPGARDSSVGGPLLWPEDEKWPVCDDAHYGAEPGPVELVAVAQLFRRDILDFTGPDGIDLAQVLWCPMDHPEREYCPKVEIRYRREADVADPVAPREAPESANEEYLLRPCVVRPVRATEYTHHRALPAALLARIEDLDDEAVDDYEDFARSRGFKAGGLPNWSMTDPEDMACEACAAPMRLLMTIDGWEEDDAEDRTPTDMQIGRGVSLDVWACRTGLPHPTRTRMGH